LKLSLSATASSLILQDDAKIRTQLLAKPVKRKWPLEDPASTVGDVDIEKHDYNKPAASKNEFKQGSI
jgi:hypothetical protein